MIDGESLSVVLLIHDRARFEEEGEAEGPTMSVGGGSRTPKRLTLGTVLVGVLMFIVTATLVSILR
jgi:hypothetical protein